MNIILIPKFSSTRYCLALLFSLLFFVGPAMGSSVMVTKDGKPLARIVVANNSDPWMSQTAILIRDGIQKMSGALLDIIDPDELDKAIIQKGVIQIPKTEESALAGKENVPGEKIESDPSVPQNYIFVGMSEPVRKLGVTEEGLEPGGIRIVTKPNSIVLLGGPSLKKGQLGADPSGIQNAGIELLNHLGFCYLWPGKLGLVIPKNPSIKIDSMDMTYNPSIRARGLRIPLVLDSPRAQAGLKTMGMSVEEYRAGEDKVAHPKDTSDSLEKLTWGSWQRLGGAMPTFGHEGAGLIDAEKQFTEHPEWFALQGDGTREQLKDPRFTLCMSNPALIQHVADEINKRLDENPNLEIISLDLNDGSSKNGFCICEACMALDPPNGPPVKMPVFTTKDRQSCRQLDYVSLSDRMVYYWNAVAEKVQAKHPNVAFGISAYSLYSDPPVKNKLHGNFVLRYAPAESKQVLGWKNAGAKHLYWRPNILLFNRRTGKLGSVARSISTNMKDFVKAGVVQTDFDSIIHNWATAGTSYYVTAQLLWNPNLTSEEILRDYAKKGFGAAAPFIEKYCNRIDDITEKGFNSEATEAKDLYFSPAIITELRGYLNSGEAAAKAARQPEVVERIAFLRLGLNFTELQEMLDLASRRAAKNLPNDSEQIKKMVDLNRLVLWDIARNHNDTVDIAQLVHMTGGFARFAPIQGAGVTISDPALLSRLSDPKYGWTGHEDNMQQMLKAFDL